MMRPQNVGFVADVLKGYCETDGQGSQPLGLAAAVAGQ
jgi:hypothetical protein